MQRNPPGSLEDGIAKHAKAREHYASGCDAGIGFGCVGLSVLHQKGQGVPRSRRQAKEYRARACQFGERKYCD